MHLLTRALDGVERVTNTLAIVAMFISMLIVSFDAGCRYFLSAPQPWVRFVLVLYLLPCIFFMALPGSYSKGVHLSVDILSNAVSAVPRLALSVLARVVGLFVFILLAYYGWGRFAEAFQRGEIQPGNALNYPLWPGLVLVPIGCALAALRCGERLVIETRALTSTGRAREYLAAASAARRS